MLVCRLFGTQSSQLGSRPQLALQLTTLEIGIMQQAKGVFMPMSFIQNYVTDINMAAIVWGNS